MRQRLIPRLELLEERTVMTVLIGDGGQGGTTRTAPLNPDLNLIRYQWDNFFIPDEFQILFRGKRIAGDVGLQSDGHQGQKVITARSSSDQLTVKVTAPLEGTAWTFRVEILPFELNVDGRLGDVLKVDVAELLKRSGVSLAEADLKADGFGLKATTNTRGKVAQTDKFQDDLKKGLFYFAPTVAGTALDYNATRNDAGLGESMIVVTNNGHEFPIKFRISDGFSTSGDNVVTFGTKKLDVFRQQQRLAYLGFPGSTGSALTVDGAAGTNTEWAKKVFNVATNPAVFNRGLVPAQGTSFFKANINSAQAPFWNSLTTVPRLGFSGTPRTFGMDASGRLIENALSALPTGPLLPSTGVSRMNGTSPPSSTHDGGRSVDFDIPGNYFFNERIASNGVSYVGAANGRIVIRDGNNFTTGNPAVAADRANGVRTSELVGTTTATLVTAIRGLIDYKQAEDTVRAMLDAFLTAGSPIIFYNDPRFINGGTIRFSSGHFDHIHFGIPSPITVTGTSLSTQASGTGPVFAAANFAGTLATGRLSNAIDLGRIDGTKNMSGTLNATQSELIYRLELGTVNDDIHERPIFDTLRDLSILVNGLADNVDVEVLVDPNGDDHGQVLFNSTTPGTAAESINAMQIASGIYYIRVFKQGGNTGFNLAVTVPPLPVPADNAGNTLTNAADLGTLTGTVNRTDFVGEVDTDDFYRFQLSQVSDLDLTVNGLAQGDVSVSLGRDDNLDGTLDPGEILAQSDVESNDPEVLNLDLLPAGNYVLVVSQVSGNTDYQLQLITANSTLPMDQAGDTIATAFDAGSLTAAVSVNDFVGGVDPLDLYRFTLTSVLGVTLNLSGLSSDADLQIGRDANNDGTLDDEEVFASSQQMGTTSEMITLAGLSPGTYVIRVVPFEGDTPYNLSITPMAAQGTELAVTRPDPTPATNLGSQFTYRLVVTNNGPDTATNVVLTETIPDGLELIRVDRSIARTSTGFEGGIGTLAAGASVTFTVTVTSFASGDLLTVSTVTADTQDFDLSNNTIETVNVVNSITSPATDLELTQSVSNIIPEIGDQITLTLTLANKGPGTATVIRIRDLLPPGLMHLSNTPDLGTYDPVTGIWNVGNMPPNTSVRLRITVQVVSGGALRNTAELIAVDEADPDSTPNNRRPNEDDQTTILIRVGGTGALFLDLNADGVQQQNERVLSGRLVYLDQNNNGRLDSREPRTTTAADGTFVLDGAGTLRPVLFAGDFVFGEGTSIRFSHSAVAVRPVANLFQRAATSREAFVRAAFRATLGREANRATVNFYLARLARGATRLEVATAIWTSSEHRLQQIDGYYRDYLRRAATAAERLTWLRAFQGGATEEQVVTGLLTSDEYLSAFRSNAAFVNELFRVLLGREARPGETQALEKVAALGRRSTPKQGRRAVVTQFFQMRESRLRAIDGFFTGLLNREGDAVGRATSLQALGAMSYGDLAIRFLASEEFFRRAATA